MAGPTKPAKAKLVAQIYEAHGSLCWLCKTAMSFEFQYPDPRSVTVDHIVPLSLKGTWDTWNLRLAHKACNHARGNSIDPEEITERIGRLLRGEPVVPRTGKRAKKIISKPSSCESSSGRKRQRQPKEEKEAWAFWVDGQRIVGKTYFED